MNVVLTTLELSVPLLPPPYFQEQSYGLNMDIPPTLRNTIMFKLFLAPISVIVSFCKMLVTFTEGLDNLANAFNKSTQVALDATSTWQLEEEALNNAKLYALRKRLEEEKNKDSAPELKTDKDVQPKDDIKL